MQSIQAYAGGEGEEPRVPLTIPTVSEILTKIKTYDAFMNDLTIHAMRTHVLFTPDERLALFGCAKRAEKEREELQALAEEGSKHDHH